MADPQRSARALVERSGVNLNDEGQRALFRHLIECYRGALPEIRERCESPFSNFGESVTLYAMIRQSDTVFIAEVGSRRSVTGILAGQEPEVELTQAEDVPMHIFTELKANSILIVGPESNIGYILAEVLPRLQSGVIIQIREVSWPFDEASLQSFLQFNDAFEVLYYSEYFVDAFRDEVAKHMPRLLRDPGRSLWLRKTR